MHSLVSQLCQQSWTPHILKKSMVTIMFHDVKHGLLTFFPLHFSPDWYNFGLYFGKSKHSTLHEKARVRRYKQPDGMKETPFFSFPYAK
jgi:hypothetical protein